MEFVLSNDCCRICLRKDDNIHKISIFSEFKEGFSIASIVELLFSVHIVVTDKLDQICEKCLRGVESVHQIYCKVQENNVKYNLLCSAEYDKVDILLEEDSNQAVIETVDNFLAVQVKEEPQDEFLLEEDVSQTKRRSTRTLKKDTKKDVGSKKATKKGKRGKRRLTKQKTVESNKKQKLQQPQIIDIKIEKPDLQTNADNEWNILETMLESDTIQTENDSLDIRNPEDNAEDIPDVVLEAEVDVLNIENHQYDDIDHYENVHTEIANRSSEVKLDCDEKDERKKSIYVDSDKSWDPINTAKKSKYKKKKKKKKEKKVREYPHKPCHLCGKMVKYMHTHIFTHDTEGALRKYECDLCGKAFHKKSRLREHLRRHIATPSIQCPYAKCNKRYRTMAGCTAHIKGAHIKHRPFVCDICDKTYTTKCNLMSHRKVHLGGGQPSNTCVYCSDIFVRQNELIAHIETIHADQNHVFYNCQECDSKHISEKRLQLHCDTVHFKSLQCPTCGQKFSTQYALNSHSLKHLTKKPDFLKCPDCNKEFSSKVALKRHSLKHTNTILHNCEICGKGYTRLDSYKVHMKSHD